MIARAATLLSLLFPLLLALPACGDGPEQAYLDFLDRAERDPPEATVVEITGQVADISGNHLYNVYIRPLGNVFLPLRATFEDFSLQEDGTATVRGAFRLANNPEDFGRPDPVSEPLAVFEAIIEEDGFMDVDLGTVFVPENLSPIEDTSVLVNLRFSIIVIDEDEMCGFVDNEDSVVIEPIGLSLRGTTLGSLRYAEDGTEPPEVPTACAGLPEGVEPEPSVGEPGQVRPPTFITRFGQVADIGGRFFMRAQVSSSLDLRFIMDAEFIEGPRPEDCRTIAQGLDLWVRAELRSYTDDGLFGPDDPPVGAFCSQISQNGRFNASVPGLRAPSRLGDVDGDIALGGIILDADHLCAFGAGNIREPLRLPLDNTPVGFVRIPEDVWDQPEDAPSSCPDPQADPPEPFEEEGLDLPADGRWYIALRPDAENAEGYETPFAFMVDLTQIDPLPAEGSEAIPPSVIDAVVRRFDSEGASPTARALGVVSASQLERGQFLFEADGVLNRMRPEPTDDDPSPSVIASEGTLTFRALRTGEDTLCGVANLRLFRPLQAPFASVRFDGVRLPTRSWEAPDALPTDDCPF